MTTPVIVLTDHLNATTGDLNIEVGHSCHFQCVSASTLGGGDWTQAKTEWSIDDTAGDYATGMRGFNFSHYHRETGTFTVTCTVTNVNGEVGTGQRTIVVGASTRTTVTVNEGDDLYTVFSANTGADKEFVLTGNVTCSANMSRYSNTVFRSSVDGVRRTIAWTGGTPNSGGIFGTQNSSVTQVSIRDFIFTVGGANFSAFVIKPNGTNHSIINCDIQNVSYDQMIDCANNPRGVLIQDTTTTHDNSGQNIWAGSDASSRMMCIYGGSHISTVNNGERTMRGHGTYLSLHDTTFLRTSDSKEPVSYAEIDYGYAFKMTCLNESTGGISGPMLIGHTSGTNTSNHLVFDRCTIGGTQRGNNTLRIGPNDSAVTDIVFRNCIFLNLEFRQADLTKARWYHNTNVNTIGTGKWFRNSPAFSTQLTVYGNLFIQPNSILQPVTINTITNLADEVIEFSYNVTGENVTVADVTAADSVNGDTNETWTAFNARAFADGNLRLDVELEGNYRPVDTANPSLLIPPHADMAIFAEDYYGNPRVNATWLVGAVDVNPVLYFPIQFGSSTLILKTLGG